MKKKISKIMAVLLSVLILLTQAVPAFAALTKGSKYDFETRYLDAYYDTGTWETADGHTHDNYGQVALRNLKSTGEPIYCIQIYNAVNGDAATAKDIYETSVWKSELSGTARIGIRRVSIYGYPNYTYGYSATDAQLATQVLMWDFEIDRRSDFSVATTAFAKNIFSNYPDAQKCYLEILNACSGHYIRPDFDSTKITLKGTGSENAVNIYDANFVLSNYTVSASDSRIKTEMLGNRLTVYATGTGSVSGRLILTKKNTDINSVFALTGANQTLLYGTIEDPVRTVLTVEMISLGNLNIRKTAEDNNVAGISFTITGSGYSKTATTDNNGNISLTDLQPGTYTVTENSSDKYAAQKSQTVTVESGKTASVTFNNVLKKFRVTVTKTDAEKGAAQGDATLAGAVYGIYNNGALVDTYTTDADGKFTTKYYVCGNNWTIREITPSTGYLLDETEYKIGAEAKNYTAELNSIANTVQEQVIKGNVAIIKHIGNGSAGVETPESGAEFQLYLKSAGSYENANADERDTLVCDENGYAASKDLPYGVYTLHQSKGWDGTEYVSDFDVYISENGETHRYIMNNPLFNGYLKVVKTDAETGKTIAYAGAGFRIYKPDGTLVTQSFTYPESSTIDTFYTNSNGELITPEVLEYGKGYKLVEVHAPFGYILDSTPIIFDVTQENSTTQNALTIVKVNKSNLAQKGVIEITKTGEIFTSVMQNEDTYKPIFEEQYLADVTFNIYAAEDIVTPDGTIRVKKGTLVDTLTTNTDGNAKSKALYLGKYIVKEIDTPYPFVTDEAEYVAELTYGGQDIELTFTSLNVYNERQNVSVTLQKQLEQDELFSIGMNNEIESVEFGLYAAEEIMAQDGSIIPADALVATDYCNNNGSISFSCDLPIGFKWYVKEIATDEHYIIDDTKYKFNTNYQGEDIKTIAIAINNGDSIENSLKRGELEGLKLNDKGNALAGATIGLFSADETEFTEDTAFMTTVSAKDGKFSFSKIPFGSYIVKELQAPKDYLLDQNNYVVEINEDKQIISIEIVNVIKHSSIHGLKVDNNDKMLEGALIGLFPIGTKAFTKDTALMIVRSDEDGKFAFNDLEIGSYIVKEIEAPNGYILDDKNYEVTISENDQIIEIKIVNTMKIGELTLTNNYMTSPKTGADYSISIIFAIITASIITTALFTLKRGKDKKCKK